MAGRFLNFNVRKSNGKTRFRFRIGSLALAVEFPIH
jgi:hypothetical protein